MALCQVSRCMPQFITEGSLLLLILSTSFSHDKSDLLSCWPRFLFQGNVSVFPVYSQDSTSFFSWIFPRGKSCCLAVTGHKLPGYPVLCTAVPSLFKLASGLLLSLHWGRGPCPCSITTDILLHSCSLPLCSTTCWALPAGPASPSSQLREVPILLSPARSTRPSPQGLWLVIPETALWAARGVSDHHHFITMNHNKFIEC